MGLNRVRRSLHPSLGQHRRDRKGRDDDDAVEGYFPSDASIRDRCFLATLHYRFLGRCKQQSRCPPRAPTPSAPVVRGPGDHEDSRSHNTLVASCRRAGRGRRPGRRGRRRDGGPTVRGARTRPDRPIRRRDTCPETAPEKPSRSRPGPPDRRRSPSVVAVAHDVDDVPAPGWRYETPGTSRPRRMRRVWPARNPRVV